MALQSGALLFPFFINALANLHHRYSVVYRSDTHFPFLTAQWKAAMSGDNQIDTRLQAARNGALIVLYMHQLCSHAYPDRGPSQLETCHATLTTEMISSYLWLHWREVDPVDGEVYYRMEPIESAYLHKLSDVAETRKIMHNYIDYAMGERLESIKAALCPFWRNRPTKRARRRQSQSSTTAPSLNLQFDIPVTPSSSSREGKKVSPTKKLKRTLTDIMQLVMFFHTINILSYRTGPFYAFAYDLGERSTS